jgi:hypothetical protein
LHHQILIIKMEVVKNLFHGNIFNVQSLKL